MIQKLPQVALTAAALGAAFGLALAQPVATAQPFSATDKQYLAALRHGGLCCPNQPDVPVWYESPELAINTGKLVAESFARAPTYQQFKLLQGVVGEQSLNRGAHPLDFHEAGKVVIIAIRYYAGLDAECKLMKQMGGAMGEAPYWYGPVTYSGGLAVQPGCINFEK
ncbi:DUF732 domain-containing protein [Mycobacterium branderi]|uniref:Uncharacterized protein n=1 Tax=Mycobacterium branderi TaxID=43348 RepID=A0A7I7WFN3_9MYCO|nr:DUF732 domain-containing protein [Mycobacterium branderi]MCV7232738.1 hypothetical protein [Mycobacterium branderi]ORA40878.1 hypothetical protein BST20_01650 [Mycobacterium branderi]BBZ14778.1 hypothetical protein MBRA_49730 [Mycobacterium branderi]